MISVPSSNIKDPHNNGTARDSSAVDSYGRLYRCMVLISQLLITTREQSQLRTLALRLFNVQSWTWEYGISLVPLQEKMTSLFKQRVSIISWRKRSEYSIALM